MILGMTTIDERHKIWVIPARKEGTMQKGRAVIINVGQV
jgi:hypothetical protein